MPVVFKHSITTYKQTYKKQRRTAGAELRETQQTLAFEKSLHLYTFVDTAESKGSEFIGKRGEFWEDGTQWKLNTNLHSQRKNVNHFRH